MQGSSDMDESGPPPIHLHLAIPLVRQYERKGFLGRRYVTSGDLVNSVGAALFQKGGLLGHALRSHPNRRARWSRE